MDVNKTKEHIEEHIWSSLAEDRIDRTTYLKVLEHTSGCVFCADKMAYVIGRQNSVSPPLYLEEEIREKAGELKIRMRKDIRYLSKRLQLMLYSLKIGFAVAVSILMLAVMPWSSAQDFNMPRSGTSEETRINQIKHRTNVITQTIDDWTNKLFNGGKP